ncbi:unnamed protein product [Protopolystoma xenopodis]|uniref:Uncharacterized protein n=1 Tax=Protopolystoma xenopodis TaxID=117903 RepID=A0A3S5BR55_9PLAT|nr:unnamed protein product [Protopolystoma xenopodis]
MTEEMLFACRHLMHLSKPDNSDFGSSTKTEKNTNSGMEEQYHFEGDNKIIQMEGEERKATRHQEEGKKCCSQILSDLVDWRRLVDLLDWQKLALNDKPKVEAIPSNPPFSFTGL